MLTKKHSHPSSDIITILAGLDHVDTVFTDFVSTLDGIIRNGTDCVYPLDTVLDAVQVWLTDGRCSGSAPQGHRGAAGRLGGCLSDDAPHVHDTEGLVPIHYEGMLQRAECTSMDPDGRLTNHIMC